MPTGPAFYERLTGHLTDGQSIDDFDERTLTILSVMDSMQRILNSRAGALKHLPDYGLSDLTGIYRDLPAGGHRLMREIQLTLLKYEPRLKAVEVALRPPEDGMQLGFTLLCHLKQAGLVRFGTYFMPEGRVRLTRQQDG
ncbi:type VI secretion system baseplate subunit TssE [Andreprevotia chitinilytica]|uniref:type VI secretion system baseplate subunit TssE n=1 Tax=Andreprevotia chitinilytica TaxID=396808 RepID=UPI0005563012|nr:type VI secretion system baseplate subunit TssE [Andreprevotia chitinilytica]